MMNKLASMFGVAPEATCDTSNYKKYCIVEKCGTYSEWTNIKIFDDRGVQCDNVFFCGC